MVEKKGGKGREREKERESVWEKGIVPFKFIN